MKLSFLRRAGIVAALATTLLSGGTALANGRFPASNALQFSAADPNLVILRVTFGLLVSHDRGKTFRWTCEQSVGFSGNEDPMYTVTPSNLVLASTYEGISRTTDQACNWAPIVDPASGLAKQVFIDLAASPNDGKDIVVFSSTYDRQDDAGNIVFASKLWETKDEGSTWARLGGDLDPQMLGYTLDLTKSDPNRLYVSATKSPGTADSSGYLLTSTNRGTTWDELAVPFVNGETGLYIAAVDPTNAERVYLRTSNDVSKPSRLLLREAPADGGPATIRTLYTGVAELLGFALTPAGDKVYIGGPQDGLLVASTSDFQFQKRSDVEIQCLALADDGVWACSSETSGFIAGVSKDDGATFEPLVRFCSIQGPLTCPAGSGSSTQCDGLWPQLRASLGCDSAGDASVADAGASPAAAPSGDSGCGSRVSTSTPWGALLALAAAAFAVTRRRQPRETFTSTRRSDRDVVSSDAAHCRRCHRRG